MSLFTPSHSRVPPPPPFNINPGACVRVCVHIYTPVVFKLLRLILFVWLGTASKPIQLSVNTTRRGSVSVYDRLASTHTDSSRAKDRSERAKASTGGDSQRRSSVDGSSNGRAPALREYPTGTQGGVITREVSKVDGITIGTMMGVTIPEACEVTSPEPSPTSSGDDDSDTFSFGENIVHDDGSTAEQENGIGGEYVSKADGNNAKKRSPLSETHFRKWKLLS